MTTSADEAPEDAAYEIYIMRHGIASKLGSDGSLNDAERTLTLEGRDKMKKIAKGLKRLGAQLDWIVSSPLVRAAETAQIVSESFGSAVPLDFCDGLRPGEPPERLLSFLAKQPERRRVLVVGHEPDVSLLAARLLGAGRNANLALKKGGCCLIALDHFPPKSQGQLLWWLTPRLLQAIS